MVEVNEKLTRQVAHLARLELTDHEVKTYTSQLKDILSYIEKLQEVQVENIDPMTHPLELATPLRPDEIQTFSRSSEGHSKILENAPDVLDHGFKVPPIL